MPDDDFNVQVIRKDGKPAFAVLPWDEYERLVRLSESALSDEALFDLAKAAEEEYFPSRVVDRLLAGENRVRVFREYREMPMKLLAEKVGIHPNYVSMIETGRRKGSTKILAAIAHALRVDLEDVVG